MDFPLVTILAYVFVGLLCGLLLPRFRRASPPPSRVIPGLQPSDPRKGNLGDMEKVGSLHEFLCRNHSRFGPIFKFWWGQQEVCAIGHPEYMKSVQRLDSRPYLFRFLEPLVTPSSLVYTNTTEYYRRKHAYIEPAFLQHTIEAQGQAISDIVRDDYLSAWGEFAKNGIALTANDYFLELSIKVITRFAFGEVVSDSALLRDINEADSLYWKYIEKANRGGLDESTQLLISQSVQKLNSVCEAIIAHRKSQKVGEKKLFIDYLLEEKDASLHLCEMITVFVAGFHSSGTLFAWLVYDLCRHPQVQRDIQKEIDAKSRESEPVLSLSEASSISCLRNAIDESLRLHTIMIFQSRISDTEIQFPDNYAVPARTPIIISESRVNLENGVFRNAGEYIPSRFSEPDGRDPIAFTPFGYAGKRTCPGKLLSYAEVSIVLGTLLKHFSMEFSAETELPVLANYQFITMPRSKISILLRPRS